MMIEDRNDSCIFDLPHLTQQITRFSLAAVHGASQRDLSRVRTLATFRSVR